jgi:hypothetical protein
MGVSLFPEEQKEYFDMLHAWKKAGPRTRTLTLLGGDMHFAMHSVVRKCVSLHALACASLRWTCPGPNDRCVPVTCPGAQG